MAFPQAQAPGVEGGGTAPAAFHTAAAVVFPRWPALDMVNKWKMCANLAGNFIKI